MAGIPHSQLRAEAQPPTTAGHPALCPNNLGEGPYQSLNGSNALQFPSQAGIQGPCTGREGGILACRSPRKLGGTYVPALLLCLHHSQWQECPSPKASHQYPICHGRVIYNVKKKISNYLKSNNR